jgi:hypothetical protein
VPEAITPSADGVADLAAPVFAAAVFALADAAGALELTFPEGLHPNMTTTAEKSTEATAPLPLDDIVFILPPSFISATRVRDHAPCAA